METEPGVTPQESDCSFSRCFCADCVWYQKAMFTSQIGEATYCYKPIQTCSKRMSPKISAVGWCVPNYSTINNLCIGLLIMCDDVI